MEKLYNNIVLPDNFAENPSLPEDVPYLKEPPKVINVTVGRQLFVDDFLIEKTDLEREFHKAEKFKGNPVLKAEKEWELNAPTPGTCPHSGGVWYDEKEHIYKMWYHNGWQNNMAYATSKDGINWDRPALDYIEGTNIFCPYDKEPDTSSHIDSVHCVNEKPKKFVSDTTSYIIDDFDPDTSKRYKHFSTCVNGGNPCIVSTSADGLHWENTKVCAPVGDCTTVFYNPFRKKWVYSIRSYWKNDRSREYYECDDLYDAMHREWSAHWLYGDENEKPCPRFDEYKKAYWDKYDPEHNDYNFFHFKPQLYMQTAIAYESIMVGFFDIFYGMETNICASFGAPKMTTLQASYSRDGYNFSRDRVDLIDMGLKEGTWDRGYIKSVTGGMIIHGDELWIYYSGFGGDSSKCCNGVCDTDENIEKAGVYYNAATGIAVLRRDGFVSYNGKGTLLTRPIEFTGKTSLHINAVGSCEVEILSEDGKTLAKSDKFNGDSTNAKLNFKDFDVSSLNGKTIRLRFSVDGKLYSFGFADKNGDFGGMHAAGIAE